MIRQSIAIQLEEIRREEERRKQARRDAERLCNALDWAYRYRRIEGKPFTLERHVPLEAIYADDHPHIVVMKCAQVGVSELAVTRTMHALDMGAAYWQTGLNGLNVAYLFPTAVALRDFSKERVTGVQAESEYIADMFRGGYDDVGFKQVKNSYLYLRGAWTKADGKSPGLKSFKADFLIRDEYDEMSAQAIAMSDARTRASVVNRKLDISTPTIPGKGIHHAYILSDQHEWHVPCSCGHWQVLDFFRDVRADGGYHYQEWRYWMPTQLSKAIWSVACTECGKPLDRLAKGEWRSLNTESAIRGYRIPSLSFPMISLGSLALKSVSDDPTRIEEFFRSDLGMPYSASGSRVTEQMIDAAVATQMPTGVWKRTTMGVDVGARYHYRISGEIDNVRYVRAMGTVSDIDHLDTLIRQYGVQACIIDAMPELNGTAKWAKRWPGRVSRAFYPNGLKSDLYRQTEANAEEQVININRTMAMDRVYGEIAGKEILLLPEVAHNEEMRQHLHAPTRIEVEDRHGNKRAEWVHTAPDHYYHASVYDTVARELLPKIVAPPVTAGRSVRVKTR